MSSRIHANSPLLSLPGLSLVLGCLVLLPALGAAAPAGPRVDFDRDVRPILADNCFACHGFDPKTRQAGLRLDVPEGLLEAARSGKAPVVPGSPDTSELVRRVAATDGRRMPPAATGKQLSPAQQAVLRRWVEQGARFAEHWAFVPPRRPEPPAAGRGWAVNPIDRFVLARLRSEGLRPAPPADRATLIRRLSQDLRGLPPTPAEVSGFLGDTRPGAYERLVDRLLASPRYGERMALEWLDVARYADTHGYHIDSHRDMWLWREWVIGAFNRNLSYDQFIIQQLAGDLLPNATLDQQVATGFNRNHPINFEGGAIPEEYHAAYIFDRVDTTTTAFMGLTMKCAQCHDHKYDPVTQNDFYRFYAFFNSVPEEGLDGRKGNAVPYLKVPSPEQQERLAAYDGRISTLEQTLRARAASAAPAQAAWESRVTGAASGPWTGETVVAAGLVAHYGLDEMGGSHARDAAGRQPAALLRGPAAWETGRFGGALRFDGSQHVDLGTALGFERTDKFSYGAWVRPAGREAMVVLSRMDDAAAFRGWDLYLSEGKVYVHLIHQWERNALRVNTRTALEGDGWHHLFVTYDGTSRARGVKVYVDGKPAELDVTHDTLSETIRTEKPARLGGRTPGAPFRGLIDEVRVYDRELTAAEVAEIAGLDAVREILATAPERRTAAQKEKLEKYYLETHDAAYRTLSAELAETRTRRADLDAAIPTTMVMRELEKPRDTFMLIRGQYDQKGEKVTPGTPGFLPPMPRDAPPNRMGLARWLVDPSHPLTARVAVNRFWQQYFGTGLVRTTENFGTQSEHPSHPELLDWLATEFIRSGWDVKALQRLIVTSATYRQSARVTPELQERDPENRLLARGPRFRLPAELIRDQALAVSGLLVGKIGGPSVRPYHPPGLWEEIAFGGAFTAQKYEQDTGEALYRRSMYTFWKRTCPPPSLQTFDAPEREFCMVRRSNSNTPLQALVLMNDPTYVEAARKLAERLMTEVAALPKDRIRYAVRLVLSRPARNEELRVLLGIYETQRAAFRQDPAAAEKLLSVGESPRRPELDPADLAAWTSVATALLNLDETITKN